MCVSLSVTKKTGICGNFFDFGSGGGRTAYFIRLGEVGIWIGGGKLSTGGGSPGKVAETLPFCNFPSKSGSKKIDQNFDVLGVR